MRATRAFPVVISGPSGAGKTTIVNEITAKDPLLAESVSVTTRPPRDRESHAEDYFFVSEDEFEKLKRGKLIEWARVHDHLYGTPKAFVEEQLGNGRDVVLNIDVQGGKAAKKAFPDAVLIFILTPSKGELEARIRTRNTDLTNEIQKRLRNAEEEIKRATDYDYVVVNDRLDETVATLLSIIQSERHRRDRYPDDYFERLLSGS